MCVCGGGGGGGGGGEGRVEEIGGIIARWNQTKKIIFTLKSYKENGWENEKNCFFKDYP